MRPVLDLSGSAILKSSVSRHRAVLLDAVVELSAKAIEGRPQALVVDCTLGGGGHTGALLDAYPHVRVLALDRDPEAVRQGGLRLARHGSRLAIRRARFSALVSELAGERADVILADFGLSSDQLDAPARGFSLQLDGPLDMRMDADAEGGQTAAALIASLDDVELCLVLRQGEVPDAKRLSRLLRERRPTTTAALRALVDGQVARRRSLPPSTLVFQALRMAVNDELSEIERWLADLPTCLAPGGRALAITFHSLEDRLVKRSFATGVRPCVCPPRLPVCACGRTPYYRFVLRSSRQADERERAENPRSRNARLRAVEYCGGVA